MMHFIRWLERLLSLFRSSGKPAKRKEGQIPTDRYTMW